MITSKGFIFQNYCEEDEHVEFDLKETTKLMDSYVISKNKELKDWIEKEITLRKIYKDNSKVQQEINFYAGQIKMLEIVKDQIG